MSTIHQTKSEELMLSKRGYKLLSKIGEGAYAIVKETNLFLLNFIQILY